MNYHQMKISEFAKLTGISRESLIFYDQQGLLMPHSRGINGYRYYDQAQLNYAYLVTTFRKIGISIKNIKKFNQQQSPESLNQLFNQQITSINDQISKLTTTRDTLRLSSQLIEETIGNDFNAVTLKRLVLKPIYVGPIVDHNDYSKANLAFYKFCNQRGINLISPFGMILTVNHHHDGPKIKIKNCYFVVSEKNNDMIESGAYAVDYHYGNDDSIDQLVTKVVDYVHDHDLKAISDVYVDYPFNEITSNDNLAPLMRCFIKVQENNKKHR